jgi:hypothetical protein
MVLWVGLRPDVSRTPGNVAQALRRSLKIAVAYSLSFRNRTLAINDSIKPESNAPSEPDHPDA